MISPVLLDVAALLASTTLWPDPSPESYSRSRYELVLLTAHGIGQCTRGCNTRVWQRNASITASRLEAQPARSAFASLSEYFSPSASAKHHASPASSVGNISGNYTSGKQRAGATPTASLGGALNTSGKYSSRENTPRAAASPSTGASSESIPCTPDLPPPRGAPGASVELNEVGFQLSLRREEDEDGPDAESSELAVTSVSTTGGFRPKLQVPGHSGRLPGGRLLDLCAAPSPTRLLAACHA